MLYSHISSGMSVSWGESGGNGLVSVEYLFEGEAAHGAGDPWNGRSALDAVELAAYASLANAVLGTDEAITRN